MENKNLYKKLGKNIKNIRKDKGLTQDKLSEKVKLSIEFIGRIEIATSKPSLDTLFKIAKVLDIEPYELLK
jgi:transcriptional regulator with XRE-family HTH domain